MCPQHFQTQVVSNIFEYVGIRPPRGIHFCCKTVTVCHFLFLLFGFLCHRSYIHDQFQYFVIYISQTLDLRPPGIGRCCPTYHQVYLTSFSEFFLCCRTLPPHIFGRSLLDIFFITTRAGLHPPVPSLHTPDE